MPAPDLLDSEPRRILQSHEENIKRIGDYLANQTADSRNKMDRLLAAMEDKRRFVLLAGDGITIEERVDGEEWLFSADMDYINSVVNQTVSEETGASRLVDLTDVNIVQMVNGSTLIYDSVTQTWFTYKTDRPFQFVPTSTTSGVITSGKVKIGGVDYGPTIGVNPVAFPLATGALAATTCYWMEVNFTDQGLLDPAFADPAQWNSGAAFPAVSTKLNRVFKILEVTMVGGVITGWTQHRSSDIEMSAYAAKYDTTEHKLKVSTDGVNWADMTGGEAVALSDLL